MDEQKYRNDLPLNSYICPICHTSQMYAHPEQIYQHDHHKCASCGYMETKSQTHQRVYVALTTGEFREDLVSKASRENHPMFAVQFQPNLDDTCKDKLELVSCEPKESSNLIKCNCCMCTCRK